MHEEHVRLSICVKSQQAPRDRRRSPARESLLVNKTLCLCLAQHLGASYCKRIQFVGAVLRRRLVGRRSQGCYQEERSSTAFVPNCNIRQKGRPPRVVDDTGGVCPVDVGLTHTPGAPGAGVAWRGVGR